MDISKPFKQTAPDQLHAKQGGGCLSILGIPFFAAGIFIILIAVGIIPLENQNELPGFAWIAMIFMGIIFTVVGGTLTFGRIWITIDVTRQVIQKYTGLLVPMRSEEISLVEFVSVEINLQTGDSKHSDQYPVILKARSRKDFRLFSSVDYGKSYEQAVIISKFIRLPLEDRTSDHPTTISPDQIGEKQKEKVNFNDSLIGEIPKPLALKSRIEEIDNAIRISIPLFTTKALRLIEIIIPLIFLIIVIPNFISFFRRTNTLESIGDIFIAFIIIFFILVPVFRIIFAFRRAGKSGTVVTVSSSQIVIEEKKGRRSQTKIIPAYEIMGIDYSTKQSIINSAQSSMKYGTNQKYETATSGYPPPKWLSLLTKFARSKGITIKSKSGLYTFGAGLSDEEVLYLYSILKNNIEIKN